MAVNGSLATSEISGRSLTFSWSQSSQSIENNTTTISWSLKGSGSYGSDPYHYWVAVKDVVLTINGTTYKYWTGTQTNCYNGTIVGSGSLTIPHTSDGSKSFSVSVSAWIYSGTTYNSGSFTLNTIPRAGLLTSATDVTVPLTDSATSTVKWTSYSSSFYYRLGVSVPASAGTAYETWSQKGKGISSSTISFTSTWISKITKSTSATATVTLETYSDSGYKTKIGSSTRNITLTVPYSDSSMMPTATITASKSPAGSTTYFSGKICSLVDKLAVSASCTGQYGATIAGCILNLYRGTSTAADNKIDTISGTSGTFMSNGNALDSANTSLTIEAVITDSRGITGRAYKMVNIYQYFNPQIAVKFEKQSSACYLHLSGRFADVYGANTKKLTLTIKKGTETVGKDLSIDSSYIKTATGTTRYDKYCAIDSETAYTIPDAYITDIETETYSFEVTATDSVTAVTATAYSGVTALSLLAGGKGAAFFKEATTEGLLDVNGNLKVAGDIINKTSLDLKNYTAVGGMYSSTEVRFTVHTGIQTVPTSAKLVLTSIRIRAHGLQSDNYTDKGTLTAVSTDLSNGSVSFTLTGIAPQSGAFTAHSAAAVLLSGTLQLTY